MIYSHASYLAAPLRKKVRDVVLKEALACLKRKTKKFDAIAFSGMSGALMAPIIAHTLGKYLILVRKTTDNCHSGFSVEGVGEPVKYIVLDDCIDQGKTANRIIEQISKKIDGSVCVGIYLYWENRLSRKAENDYKQWLPPKGPWIDIWSLNLCDLGKKLGYSPFSLED